MLWLIVSVGFKAIGFVILPYFFLSTVNGIFGITEVVAIIGLWLLEKWGFVLTLIIFGMGIASAMVGLQQYLPLWALIFNPEAAPVYILIVMSDAIYLMLDIVFAVYISKFIFIRLKTRGFDD